MRRSNTKAIGILRTCLDRLAERHPKGLPLALTVRKLLGVGDALLTNEIQEICGSKTPTLDEGLKTVSLPVVPGKVLRVCLCMSLRPHLLSTQGRQLSIQRLSAKLTMNHGCSTLTMSIVISLILRMIPRSLPPRTTN